MEKPDRPKVERLGIEDNKKRRKGVDHTAEQKCRAVLSVWTERRTPGEICRELGVAWTLLNQWQERAMEGMLMALQPGTDSKETPAALGTRLEALLDRKVGHRARNWSRLQERLNRIQGERVKDSGSESATG